MATSSSADGPAAEYSRRLAERRERVARFELVDRRIAAARGVTFAAGLVLLWLWLGADRIALHWMLVPIVAFVTLVLRHDRVIRERRRGQRAAAHYERGLARLDDRWIGTGASGERFLEGAGALGEDLDLFGRGSLFELVSGAKTRVGEDTLASWLRSPASADEISVRQQAVDELRGRLDLREDLSLLGEETRAGSDPAALLAWAEGPAVRFPAWASPVGIVLSALTIAAIVLWQGFSAPASWVLVAIAAEAAFVYRFRGGVERALHGFDRAARELGLLAHVLERFERERFCGRHLLELGRSLETEGLPPSRRIAGLARRADLLDSGRNQFFGPFAAVLLWRTQLAISVAGWRARHGSAARRWVGAIGELEALLSLAGHAYEHPADPFPELVPDGPVFEGEGLGHPLLPESRCTRNDLRIGGDLRLLVVSGSNMSGKSTLLRTIGTNAVLAFAGAPVRARRLRLSSVAIGTSIRVRDSLQEGRSRFYAEIVGLREILDLARRGPRPVFFLLDEILAGTNSHDRRIGAEGVIRAFLDRGAIGLVTTHDLALTEIAERLAPQARNVHFEDHLEEGRMVFDYRLRDGIVERSNALALMRAVGIDVGEESGSPVEDSPSPGPRPTSPQRER